MYTELIRLRRSDAVLRQQDRTRMDVTLCGELLLVHLWHGRKHRLLSANLGVAIDATPAALGAPRKLRGLDWRPAISTDERRFGGTDGRVRFDDHLVSMPPHTVAWLSASEPALPGRLLRRLRRLIRR